MPTIRSRGEVDPAVFRRDPCALFSLRGVASLRQSWGVNRTGITLEPYSLGVGDRFGHQAGAQLAACRKALERGVEVVPVWNKSHREHTTIGSRPESVRRAADAAVREGGWTLAHYVDADHIHLGNVDAFLDCSDYFTIDVAAWIGNRAGDAELDAFVGAHPELQGTVRVEGIEDPLDIPEDRLRAIAGEYLPAVREAGRIHRRIVRARGEDSFVAEVSMDETERSQTPSELLVILAALSDEKVPLQTIAPKFTGRFNKGVDYAGDLLRFEREFNDDLEVVRHAVERYGLPSNLKLSVHSGSDKYSIYPPIARAIRRRGAGLHLKTAGTTWLEELIGLAEAGGAGLDLARGIYTRALDRVDELCAPYAEVIDIDPSRLPSAAELCGWDGDRLVDTIRHLPASEGSPRFNPHVRQLLHIGYKIAAGMGGDYLDLLKECEASIARNVTTNLYERHIRPLFIDQGIESPGGPSPIHRAA